MPDKRKSGETLWNWREYFSKHALEAGARDLENGKLMHFEADRAGRWARGMTDNLFTVEVKKAPTDYAELCDYPDWRHLLMGTFARGEKAASNYYFCSCSQGKQGMRCRHLANLMLRWEAEHGPFVMYEDPEARRERLRRERERMLIKKKQQNKLPAFEYFAARVEPAPKGLHFPPDAILRTTNLQTDQYEAELADVMHGGDRVSDLEVEPAYDSDKNQLLSIDGRADKILVRMRVTGERIRDIQCECGRSRLNAYAHWYGGSSPAGQMCGHALAVWRRARERIIQENPGDRTDYNGFQLLASLTGEMKPAERAEAAPESARGTARSVQLVPRIMADRDSNGLKLGFDLGRVGGKRYAVKSLENLVKAVEGRAVMALSKTVSVDFAQERFTEESEKWHQLIMSRIRAVKNVNEKLNSGYYYRSRALSAGSGIPLEESDLDIVYDLAEGGEIQYQYGARNEVCSIRVGEARPRMELRLDPVTSGKALEGIRMTGTMPRLLRGNRNQYVLDRSCFGRVGEDELAFLCPFQAIDDGTGNLRCVIGEKKFAEFCYRVLPVLLENPQIHLTDNVSGQIEAMLPPEPEFAFFIDLSDKITCRVTVQYGEQVFTAFAPPEPGSLQARDRDQELRVVGAVRRFFPNRDGINQCFYGPNDEDDLVWILTEGVATLSRFGEVNGSEAFRRVRVRPAPQPRFCVRIEGGLLDLSVKTKDLTEEELLELLGSYRLRKRWHRLRSGDFVDLGDAAALDELAETARAMDASLEDMVRGEVQMPKYRALYVDKLLEAHNDIAASRDRHFKALVRSFQTIRDSDFEASQALADALRPYQLYGFRWLATLSQAGFGGILADEMGLGKTVQAIAYLQMRREQGESKPALVVCPASLVYNWWEECRKFAPGLEVHPVAGTLSQRKALLKDMGGRAALYITSYDLLKRDIALYDAIAFSDIVLDEAQYVKNHRSAVSKAVRVLKGDHRFALTGTPIENRLSELWSIFDFLMPGFLYAQSEFAARFEGPITKQRDAQAIAALSRMTEPFILRRRKEDVLRDLPEKLEESRRAQMDEDQRKLYDAQLVRMKNLLAAWGNSGEDKLRVLAEITRLRQICCDPCLLFDDYAGSSAKRAACLELIQSAMDAGHRMLVFSQFTSMLSLLASDLKAAEIPFYTLTGATPKQERVRLVNAFNGSEVPVFLISLKAGGTGLNLTGADVVIHYDPWWNLAVQNQATDRAHRIGQTKQVTVVKLIAADTIEEKIVELQRTKRDLAEAILSGKNTSLMSLSREELLALLG